MATVFDVAVYILNKKGELSAMKLQKLAYYAQAWSLVWEEEPLFENRIEAWANGPVCPSLYDCHRGFFKVEASTFLQGNAGNLTKSHKDTIDKVFEYYGEKSAQWLSDLTHNESPWIDARGGISPTERSNVEITTAAMHEYYSGLQ